jgi:predicted hotdog family 3-hydroxylacyl-ACP dehydratase
MEFRHLIPHQGSMCLLERVVSWDDTQVICATRTHQRSDNPLCEHGRLRALHLCEYGAQAMAVHGAVLAQNAGGHAEPGVLVSLREVKLACDFIESLSDELIVTADRLHVGDGSMQYRFRIEHRGDALASGRAAVMTRTASRI